MFVRSRIDENQRTSANDVRWFVREGVQRGNVGLYGTGIKIPRSDTNGGCEDEVTVTSERHAKITNGI